ncbi:MAG TPA: RimK/LysX family protein [Thermoplasmata archaeon]
MIAAKRSRRRPRPVIGIVVDVKVRGPAGEHRVRAKVDTGAERTSIDTDVAKAAGLGPVLRQVRIRAAAAERPEIRDVMRATLVIAGQPFEVEAAITDRKDMRYAVIVGMDILAASRFLVDPKKSGDRAR